MLSFKEYMQSDLDIFLNSDEFAVPVVWNGNSFNGLFSDASGMILTAGVGVAVVDPQVLVKTSDASGIKRKDAITVNGTAYYVRDHPKSDGMGRFTTLYLSEDLPA